MVKLSHWVQIWKLSNKYSFSKRGFFKFFLGYLLSSGYKLVYRVDKKNNRVMGFNFIEHGRIKRLVVDDFYRGKGIGSSLVPDYCSLVYTDGKRGAIGFYKRLGFKSSGMKSKNVYVLKRA